MSALGKVVRAGVGRRRVQTFVMTMTTMMSVAASVLALGIIVAAHGPFDRAFAQQKGAHLSVQFDAVKADAGQVAGTAHVSGVTAAAGPFPARLLRPVAGTNRSEVPVGTGLRSMLLVGRTDPGGAVDRLRLVTGTWATGPGQVVLSDRGELTVGDKMQFPDAPGKPTLTVVGLARSVGGTADGWLAPEVLAGLAPGAGAAGSTVAAGSPAGPAPAGQDAGAQYQMLYRFASADTDAQLVTDRSAIAAAVPAGSLTGVGSYRTVKVARDKSSAPYVPFVVAFGLLGLAMSVLIIAVVVSGAVGAATRRIGILKALGFGPAQVARAYVGQALIPSGFGAAFGVFIGNVGSLPVLNKEANAFDEGRQFIPLWIDVVVPLAVLLAVVATALPSALRAGRLRTVEALAVGRTPKSGGARNAREALGRLPLPRALSLGLGHPLARPGRTATTAAAVLLGTIGVTFGVGLALSLKHVNDGMMLAKRVGPVQVSDIAAPTGKNPNPKPAAPEDIAKAIAAQPGTRRYFATSATEVSVAGLAGQTTVVGYQGDYSWGALQMVSGSWFSRGGEAVAPSGFLHTTGTHVGDTIVLTDGTHRVPVRITGEVFDLEHSGMALYTDSASLAGLDDAPALWTYQFDIDLKPGVDLMAYQRGLNGVLPTGISSFAPPLLPLSPTFIAMDTLTAMLTLGLVLVAGLGVLNMVLLDTRERVHDLGVYKALGMSPKQTAAMTLTSVALIGLVAGLVGVPLGVLLHHQVMPVMGHAAGTDIPAADGAVFGPPVLGPLLAGGLVIAVLGAALPAGWAARTRTAVALRTE